MSAVFYTKKEPKNYYHQAKETTTHNSNCLFSEHANIQSKPQTTNKSNQNLFSENANTQRKADN